MSLAIIKSLAERGITAPEVSVEVHLTGGLPAFSIVGLPEAAVRESKDRVRSAIINSKFEFPRKKITVNLAPADLPKEGGRYDLAIAVGILVASGQIDAIRTRDKVFLGELALSGSVRQIKGILIAALALVDQTVQLIVPQQNAAEAVLAPNVEVIGIDHLLDLVSHLHGLKPITLTEPAPYTPQHEGNKDLSDIKGQQFAKHALKVAAAGEHNILLYGPPGTGKTMLASRFAGLLPPLTEHQALQSAALNSLSQDGLNINTWRDRPYRSPHHSASAAAIVGGGAKAQPGEISLAHNGILFLDELTEFDRKVLETMREPMESGEVSIARAAYRNVFPAKFLLIAAMNPCKDGYYGDSANPTRCNCTPAQIQQYRSKLSGPLLDRIDIHIEVPRVPQEILSAPAELEPSTATVRSDVLSARAVQLNRQDCLNSSLSNKQIERFCQLDADSNQLLNSAIERLGLSARSYHRILKLSRTIADLSSSANIEKNHVMQAIQFRSFDRAV